MADETTTLLGSGDSLTKSQAIDELLNVDAPEEASEDVLEPNAETEAVEETEEVEATSEDEYEEDDAEELSESEYEEEDDEEYDVDVSEVEEVEDEDTYYTVKVDGEEKDVTADELVKSYQLEQAAQKRMQEASEVRKNSEAEMQAMMQQREQYAQALNELQANLKSATDKPQEYWDKLYTDDPIEYMRQREAARDQKDAAEQVALTQQKLEAERQQELSAQNQVRLQQEQEKLLQALPEWKDPEVADREKQAIITYSQRNLGFSEAEISDILSSVGSIFVS